MQWRQASSKGSINMIAESFYLLYSATDPIQIDYNTISAIGQRRKGVDIERQHQSDIT